MSVTLEDINIKSNANKVVLNEKVKKDNELDVKWHNNTLERRRAMFEDFKKYLEWCEANGKKPCYSTSLEEYMKALQK